MRRPTTARIAITRAWSRVVIERGLLWDPRVAIDPPVEG
jgi:hypothetical protein